MPWRRRILALVCALVALGAMFVPRSAASAQSSGVPRHFLGDRYVRAVVRTESPIIARGGVTWLALELTTTRGWHIYWRNPGDAGGPPTAAWTLPRGISVGPTSWPAPERRSDGGIVTYVYQGRTILLVPLVAGRDTHLGPTAVRADVSWLVCSNVCVPGSGKVNTTLTVAPTASRPDPENAAIFAAARARLPSPANFDVTFTQDAAALRIAAPRGAFIGRVTGAYFFPLDKNLVAHSVAQQFGTDDGGVALTLPRKNGSTSEPRQIDGVFAVESAGPDGRRITRDYEITARRASLATTSPPVTLVAALLLAFLGGIVLNVMPCVFPVLSFKAIGAIQESDARRRWTRAAAYAAGVVASTSALGLLLLALRSGGAAIGWGFQFQSPLFVALLALLLLALALSMSGVAEFVVPVPGAVAHRGGSHGTLAAFTDGALVTLIASACTAPFMGAALGYAVSASAPAGLGVFAALGVGLALPYVVVTGVPAIAARLPKPGAWMVAAQRLFAFPLYLTVAWLIWVFSQQVDAGALLSLLIALVCVAFAVSAYGASFDVGRAWRRTCIVFSLAGLVAAVAIVAPVHAAQHPAPEAADSVAPGLHYERYSAARLAELRSAHRAVLVNVTAAWCITCQVNDRLALGRPDVLRRFADRHATLLRADWTNQDAAITAYLEQFGRSGVPLYVYYAASGNVEVWPQILTPGLVIDKLDRG